MNMPNMRFKYHNLFLLLTAVLLVFGLTKYNPFISKKAAQQQQGLGGSESQLEQEPGAKAQEISPAIPQEAKEETKTPPPEKISGSKLYKSPQYEFEFTYPAEFGDVSAKNYPCPKGFMTISSFSANPNIDFGFVSDDYEKCDNKEFLLFEIISFDLLKNKLEIYRADSDSSSFEAPIEKNIPTLTPEIAAYVIKNTFEKSGNGYPAAILRRPNPRIGPLVFRTHSADGLKLLEAIIK